MSTPPSHQQLQRIIFTTCATSHFHPRSSFECFPLLDCSPLFPKTTTTTLKLPLAFHPLSLLPSPASSSCSSLLSFALSFPFSLSPLLLCWLSPPCCHLLSPPPPSFTSGPKPGFHLPLAQLLPCFLCNATVCMLGPFRTCTILLNALRPCPTQFKSIVGPSRSRRLFNISKLAGRAIP